MQCLWDVEGSGARVHPFGMVDRPEVVDAGSPQTGAL